MRFKIDENLPVEVAELLRRHGHDRSQPLFPSNRLPTSFLSSEENLQMSKQMARHRTGLFILSIQLDRFCEVLREIVLRDLPLGPATISLAQRFKGRFESVTSGPAVEGIPDIDETLSGIDVLMIVEVLNATLLAFLSPEDVENRREFLGFGPPPETRD